MRHARSVSFAGIVFATLLTVGLTPSPSHAQVGAPTSLQMTTIPVVIPAAGGGVVQVNLGNPNAAPCNAGVMLRDITGIVLAESYGVATTAPLAIGYFGNLPYPIFAYAMAVLECNSPTLLAAPPKPRLVLEFGPVVNDRGGPILGPKPQRVSTERTS